ncbi:Phospholipase/carboxylesterase/thioesterase [Peziza echinospora]|nr:Phospholipase/carboxylesterase/thioesterase [Peziza echinospora]
MRVFQTLQTSLPRLLANMTSAAAIVVPAATTHTATFIFLHGLGDTGAGWSSISENFRLRRKFDEVAFIFPHAPTIPITCNGGMRMPGWYDITDFPNLSSSDDEAGMLRSISAINAIIGEQVDKGIPPERIIVGGFSQGCAIALLTGLTSERPLGGIVALSGYLAFRDKIAQMRTEVSKKIPIFMAHGKRDPVVKFAWGEESKNMLVDKLGQQKVTWKTYANLEHSANLQEMNDMEAWMEGVLKA